MFHCTGHVFILFCRYGKTSITHPPKFCFLWLCVGFVTIVGFVPLWAPLGKWMLLYCDISQFWLLNPSHLLIMQKAILQKHLQSQIGEWLQTAAPGNNPSIFSMYNPWDKSVSLVILKEIIKTSKSNVGDIELALHKLHQMSPSSILCSLLCLGGAHSKLPPFWAFSWIIPLSHTILRMSADSAAINLHQHILCISKGSLEIKHLLRFAHI